MSDQRMHYGAADANKCLGIQIGWFSIGRSEVVSSEKTYRTFYIRFGPISWCLQVNIILCDD